MTFFSRARSFTVLARLGVFRAWAFVLVLLALLSLPACGGGDENGSGQAATDTSISGGGGGGTTSTESSLDELLQEVQSADVDTDPLHIAPAVISKKTMYDFLTSIIANVDEYWTATLTSAGLPEASVTYNWLEPGEAVQTACDEVTNDSTALYCPADDTIYISQQFARELWDGFVGGQYQGVTPGDFGIAYVVAHEYAHNVQHELGVYDLGLLTVQTELEADCLAGAWANSAYFQGILETGDVQEAIATAFALGDFAEITDPRHHGQPAERRQAWQVGYDSGDPAQCAVYE